MKTSFALIVTSDDLAELQRIAQQLAQAGQASTVVPTVHQATPAPGFCSGGHGQMRLIPGGTARSGPRMGQPYDPFWKCDTCGERQNLPAGRIGA